jgi:glycosyltransferase involved in cell wall biosynthesis
VIIPAYNAERFLAEAIRSAQAQTFRDCQIIVVDDGSKDRTAEVAAGFEGVRLICQSNAGVSAARNRGLAESSSEYVVFLDADDRLLPDAVELGVGLLEARPELGFVYGRHETIDADGRRVPGAESEPGPADAGYLTFLAGNPFVPPACAVFRRSVIERVGGFDPRLSMAEDLELYLRLALVAPIHCHNHVVVQFREHGGNVSHQNAARTLQGIYRAMRMHKAETRGQPEREAAYTAGRRHWAHLFGPRLLRDGLSCLLHGNVRAAVTAVGVFLSM